MYCENFVVQSDPPNQPRVFSFVYGPPIWNAKANFWYELKSCGNAFVGPCLYLGDFNAILNQHDKLGGKASRFHLNVRGHELVPLECWHDGFGF